MKFMVYSKDNCPFCEKAKMLIKNYGYEYVESKLNVDFDRDELMEMFPDARSFPIIIKLTDSGNTRIGGCDDLEKYLSIKEMTL